MPTRWHPRTVVQRLQARRLGKPRRRRGQERQWLERREVEVAAVGRGSSALAAHEPMFVLLRPRADAAAAASAEGNGDGVALVGVVNEDCSVDYAPIPLETWELTAVVPDELLAPPIVEPTVPPSLELAVADVPRSPWLDKEEDSMVSAPGGRVTQEISLLEVFEIGDRTAGIRNTGNAITRMAQVAFSYMSKFGGPPGINFGANSYRFSILQNNYFWCEP